MKNRAINLIMAITVLLLITCLSGCYRALLAGDPEGYEQCIEVDISVNRSLPEVFIALDRSNSMQYDGFWDDTRDAVISITSTYDDTILFGLMVFPDLNCVGPGGTDYDCSSESPPVVGNALHNGGAIRSALESMTCCGGTPIAHTLATAAQYLYDRPPENPKYILLATDGAPNCNMSLDPYTCTCTCTDPLECALCDNPITPFPSNCLDNERALAALGQLRRDGITTYVIALSGAAREWGDVLEAMAAAGGTEFYFAAEDTNQVQAIFETVMSMVAWCEVGISPGDAPETELVNIYIDGVLIPLDDTNASNWNWLGDYTIEFHGEMCDRIVNEEVVSIEATFGCPTQRLHEE